MLANRNMILSSKATSQVRTSGVFEARTLMSKSCHGPKRDGPFILNFFLAEDEDGEESVLALSSDSRPEPLKRVLCPVGEKLVLDRSSSLWRHEDDRKTFRFHEDVKDDRLKTFSTEVDNRFDEDIDTGKMKKVDHPFKACISRVHRIRS
uniref:Uncharacterized protein n=1 Tax=Chromera velia CCMP2878 TaxID=1169474 RepID=A0A0G4GRC5_9ALVE|eukprot:Cvel_23039.t1-p1 / transcript=Cvel_23039.t1 / gene=Cvel_23039 / organism=Chromera_velia_CCMP2878 / gene_product=hypothetical protein / transcript_product=hypothetical protein / location=Cvel_scaffold2329:11834-12280(+) / protein_length=149 / sequence_SO=supercontig / SO=protein_coding / is_pseudo=false